MSGTKGWHYYNHALLPDCAPHEKVDTEVLQTKTFWKKCAPNIILARWTDEFDCDGETSWWYVIKDTPFDINVIKSKRRYEIRKGLKFFEVSIINPSMFSEELYRVQVDAYDAYPKKYRPSVDKTDFQSNVCTEWCNENIIFLFSWN